MSTYLYIILALSIGTIFYDGIVANRGHGNTVPLRRCCYGLFFVLCSLMIICVAGLRGNMATDMVSYASEYKKIATMSFGEIFKSGFRLQGGNSTEIGFVLLNKILSMLGISNNGFFFIMSLLSFLPYCIFAYKKSEMPFISLFFLISFGYFFHSFNVIRSCFIAGMYCLCIDDILDNRFKTYVIKVLILFTFHSAALLLLPLYFVRNYSFLRSKKSIGIILGIGFVVSQLGTIFSFFDRILFGSFYTTIYVGNTLNKASTTEVLPCIIILVIVFLVEYSHKKDLSTYEIVLTNGTFLWSILGLMRLQMGVFSRYQDMLCIFPAIYIPYLLYRCIDHADGKKNILIRLIAVTLITCVCVMWFHKTISDSPYNPYYTFFN